MFLRDKCPYSEFFWSVFSHIRIQYREILRISPYSVRMREKTGQKNSEYEHFSCMLFLFAYSLMHRATPKDSVQ